MSAIVLYNCRINPPKISAGDLVAQHPDSVTRGVKRNVIAIQDSTHANNRKGTLPDLYTTVPPVVLHREDPPVPKLQGPNRGFNELSL